MAGDFGDLRVAEGHFVAPVARADDVLYFFFADVAVLQRLGVSILRSQHDVRPRIDQRAADDLAVLIKNDRLGLRRSYIYPSSVCHNDPPFLPIAYCPS